MRTKSQGIRGCPGPSPHPLPRAARRQCRIGILPVYSTPTVKSRASTNFNSSNRQAGCLSYFDRQPRRLSHVILLREKGRVYTINICRAKCRLFTPDPEPENRQFPPSIVSEFELFALGRFNRALKTRFGRLFPVSSSSRRVSALRLASSHTAGNPGELETMSFSARA